jgi:GMP reductase
MRIDNDIKLDFKDVLISPKRSIVASRKQVDLQRTFLFKNSGKSWTGVPIISSNMSHTGTFEMAEKLQDFSILTALHRFFPIELFQKKIDELKKKIPNKNPFQNIMVTTGINEDSYLLTRKILKNNPDFQWICIDIANGYSETFVKFVEKVRVEYPEKIILAGNVCTPEMTEQLIIAGADVVKIGIGPGSVCTTRALTGVGYPQLSAIIECADAAHGLGGQIVSDGGCVVAGDVGKAFAAGADFVMLGGMFAGHDECDGEVIDNKMKFYGMSSQEAMSRFFGGIASYRAAEGKAVFVPHKGTITKTVQTILGGLRSTCSYSGAEKLKNLSKCTTFIRVTQQLNESLSATPI